MPLTDLEELRLRAGDPYRAFQETQLGDGSAIIFQLSSFPVRADSETFYLDGSAQSDPADYALDDDLGRITSVSAPADGAVLLVSGEASIFSDTELNDILARYGNDVRRSLIEVIEILMVNESRREKWTAGDVASDPTKIAANLALVYDRLIKRERESAIDAGGVEEWAVEQRFYT